MTDTDFRLDPNPANMEPSHLNAPEVFTTEDQTELNHTHFATADESVFSGV